MFPNSYPGVSLPHSVSFANVILYSTMVSWDYSIPPLQYWGRGDTLTFTISIPKEVAKVLLSVELNGRFTLLPERSKDTWRWWGWVMSIMLVQFISHIILFISIAIACAINITRLAMIVILISIINIHINHCATENQHVSPVEKENYWEGIWVPARVILSLVYIYIGMLSWYLGGIALSWREGAQAILYHHIGIISLSQSLSMNMFMSLPCSFNDEELIQLWLTPRENDRKVSRKLHHPQVAVPLCHRLVKALDNDLHSQHVESKICHHDSPLYKCTMILLLRTPACSHTIQMIRSALYGPSSGKDPVYLEKHSAHNVIREWSKGGTAVLKWQNISAVLRGSYLKNVMTITIIYELHHYELSSFPKNPT